MLCHVEVHNPAAIMCKNDQNEQDAKGCRGNGEEIDRNKFPDVIFQECSPVLRRRFLSFRFEGIYDDIYQREYGFWRPVIREVVDKYLDCGNLHSGFARIGCENPECRQETRVEAKEFTSRGRSPQN